MSDARVLKEAECVGAATVREVEAPGMITVKAELASAALAECLRAATGAAVPQTRRIVRERDARVAWMAPDELLLLVPRADVAASLATLTDGLAGEHALVADVSDMRAVFRIEAGRAARETLAKLCPVDLAPGVFAAGEIRRTRLAQVPAAFWIEENGFTLVCFRSVARYAFDVLKGAAAADARVGYFREV
ncbi:MAG: sarcosine oxidase subunit gamma family protein [Pseudomonadota bacterium]